MKAMRIGGKLRRLRQERHLTQAQMARELGISASYLTLLESNQRPVTVRVLLKLVERFQVDLQAFAADTDQRLSLELMEAFSDPIFEGAEVKTTDVQELVSLLPAVGRAMIDLYEAYRRHLPADATTSAGEDASETPPVSIPSEEVTEFIQKRLNHFPELEEAAEALWREDGLSIHTLQQDLMTVLRQRHGTEVEIRPADAMKGRSRRYDQLARRLQISEMLPPSSRLFQIAHQIAYLGHHPALDRIAASGNFSSSDAEALMRTALANYFASAVMMPYRMFTEAARATRYDIDILRNRFGVSFEQVCHRLTTLRRPGDEGVPFHFIRVDIAGNISKRFSASGIHIARFGAACPRWNVYDAFSTPGMLRVQISRMPDGGSFFCVARTTGRATALSPTSGLPHRVGQRAIGLGCDVRHAGEIVYADGLNVADPQIATPIGVSCRTCPRTDCAERAMPSLFQKLHIDENVRGPSTYVQA
ncbi:MAG: short-chain fatty acyl-CoA regulator family protein [Bauldia litoralis]